jgi:hypothetical protein
VFKLPYINLDILHFSIFRGPQWWLEMPYIDLNISNFLSTQAPLLLAVSILLHISQDLAGITNFLVEVRSSSWDNAAACPGRREGLIRLSW